MEIIGLSILPASSSHLPPRIILHPHPSTGQVRKANDCYGVWGFSGGRRSGFVQNRPEDDRSGDDQDKGDGCWNPEPLESLGLFPGDPDRRSRFEDDAFGDRQAVFDPDEVGQELIGGLITVFFLFFETPKNQLVEGLGNFGVQLSGWKRLTVFVSRAISGCRTLSATSSPISLSKALYTLPMPPLPSSSMIS